DELEAHLRDQIADLDAAGLSEEEAFLVAVRRMGSLDELSRQFALEHSGRLWRQLVVADSEQADTGGRGLLEALGWAIGAGAAMRVAFVVADFDPEASRWLSRNASLLVRPFLAGLLARRRGLSSQWALATLALLAGTALVVNL